MLRDLGSRGREFVALVRDVRRRLLAIAGVSQGQGYEAVPLQGSGTFGVKPCSPATPPAGKWLVVSNGAYGEHGPHRRVHGIALGLALPRRRPPRAGGRGPGPCRRLRRHRGRRRPLRETTTGILNPVEEIGRIAKKYGKTYVIDSMSAFGGGGIRSGGVSGRFLVSSANKCLEGCRAFRSACAGTTPWCGPRATAP